MSRSTPLRTPLLLFVALWASLISAVPTSAADDEIVKEFKKYFRKFKDTPTRVEAVLSLLGTESPGVVDVLVPVLKDRDGEVAAAAVRVLGSFQTRPPIDHMLEELVSQSNERIQAGLLGAIRAGAYPGCQEAVAPLLESPSWELRRAAIQSLVGAGEEGVASRIAPSCADGEVAVRCEAIDGLAHLGSELVLAPALENLGHEAWQVRASCIAALGRVRHRDSIEPLIERMAVEEGRLVSDIGAALGELTGRSFRDRLDGWQNFWSLYRDRFVMPTDEELARLRQKQAESAAVYTPDPNAVSYHGVTTPSRSILFVIDVSGSMEQEIVERHRFEGGSYPSFQRLDIVKTELARTVERLDPNVSFNILSFATDVKPWKKRLVPANVLNKSSATSWTQRLEAIGGASKEEFAAVGLTGMANLEAGKTNSYAALMSALGVEDSSEAGEDYEVSVDTVFFLSDGRPSHGRFVDTDDILREVETVNDLRKVVIHTIAIGEFEKDFMRRLAENNGGVFVDLGR